MQTSRLPEPAEASNSFLSLVFEIRGLAVFHPENSCSDVVMCQACVFFRVYVSFVHDDDWRLSKAPRPSTRRQSCSYVCRDG